MSERFRHFVLPLVVVVIAFGHPPRAAADTPTDDAPAPQSSSDADGAETIPAAAPPTVKPTEARGWEREPEPRRVLVFPAIGRAIGLGASGLVWLAVAPFRGAIYLEDRYQVSEHVLDILYNDERTAGVIPTAAFASGFGLTFGAKAFHNDLFGHSEEVSASAKYGGAAGQSFQLKAEAPEAFGGRAYLRARGRYETKGNLLFAGIGNSPLEMGGPALDPRAASIPTRYRERRILGMFSGGAVLGSDLRELRLGVSLIHNNRRFNELDSSQPDPTIGDVYDTGSIIGFDGFSLTEVTADVEFDFLDRIRHQSRALRFRSFLGGAPKVDDYAFLHYGAEIALEQTVFLPGRVVIVRLAHEGVAGKRSELPFSELPRVGGAGLLRGYKNDQFRDKLGALATLEYHYPIHAMYVEEGGRHFLRHFLVDFGEALGGHQSEKDQPQVGFEYFFDWGAQARALVSFGLWVRPWERQKKTPWKSVGYFGADQFEPTEWKERYPYEPFYYMDAADAFWATRLIMRFDRSHIEAVVAAAEFSEPAASAYLVDTLMRRRDKIAAAYLDGVTPLDDFRFVDGTICATDLTFKYGLTIDSVVEVSENGETRVLPTLGAQACVAYPSDEDYHVWTLRVRRRNKRTPPMELHLRGGANPHVIGIVR